METIKTAYYTYRTAVWLQAKVREHGLRRSLGGTPALSVMKKGGIVNGI